MPDLENLFSVNSFEDDYHEILNPKNDIQIDEKINDDHDIPPLEI